jgi:Tfp pilus assembly protein PilZ
VGIFFETEQGRSIGDAIHLTVDLGESSIECEGRIVRVEDLGRRYGIAVELTSYQFE